MVLFISFFIVYNTAEFLPEKINTSFLFKLTFFWDVVMCRQVYGV